MILFQWFKISADLTSFALPARYILLKVVRREVRDVESGGEEEAEEEVEEEEEEEAGGELSHRPSPIAALCLLLW